MTKTETKTETVAAATIRLLGADKRVIALGIYNEALLHTSYREGESAPEALDRTCGLGTSDKLAAEGLSVEWDWTYYEDGGADRSGVRITLAPEPEPEPDPEQTSTDTDPSTEPTLADAIQRLLGDEAPWMHEGHGTFGAHVLFRVEDSHDEEEDVLDALERVWGPGTAARFAAAGLCVEWNGIASRDEHGAYWRGVYVEVT